MRGPAPWRRSLDYLEKGSLIFKDKVKIMSINYHDTLPESDGLRRFVFWHLAQIQYKNPAVQCVQLKNITYTPYITLYTSEKGTNNRVLVNCYKRTQDDIHDWLLKLMCKTKEEIELASRANPANFGKYRTRTCICQIPGQVACPGYKELPKHMRGKYLYVKKDELEELRQKKSDDEALKEYWNTI